MVGMRLVSALVVLGGCLLVPPQGPPPQPAPQAPPPPEQQAVEEAPPPPPVHHHHHHHHQDDAVAATQPAARAGDDDDDDQTPPAPSQPPAHDDDEPWAPAGSVDQFGLGPQYTTEQIKKVPGYEKGHVYKNGGHVQMPEPVQPHVWVFVCHNPAGCTESPIVAIQDWYNDGWYDPKAPRYKKYTPPPPLKPGENPFPEEGKPITEAEADAAPRFEYGTVYSFGALVSVGYSTSPHTIVYRCNAKTCETSSPSSDPWVAYGWYGRD
jgi:hypothetical protein